MRRARRPRVLEDARSRTRRCRSTSLGAAAPSKEEDEGLPDEGPMARRLAGRIAYFANEWFTRSRRGEPAIHRAPAPPAPAGLVGLSKSLTVFAVASKGIQRGALTCDPTSIRHRNC